MANRINRVRSHQSASSLNQQISAEICCGDAAPMAVLEPLTVGQLRGLATFHGLRGSGRLPKPRLIKLILAEAYDIR